MLGMNEGASPNRSADFQAEPEAAPQAEKSLTTLHELMDEYWQTYRGLKNRSPRNVDGPYLHLGIDLSDRYANAVARAEISSASLDLLRQFHPDKWTALGINDPSNEQTSRELNALVRNINAARECLLNDASRGTYDLMHSSASQSQATTQEQSSPRQQEQPPPRQADRRNYESATKNPFDDYLHKYWKDMEDIRSNEARYYETERHKLHLRRQLLNLYKVVSDLVLVEAEKRPSHEIFTLERNLNTLLRSFDSKIADGISHSVEIRIPSEFLLIRLVQEINIQKPDEISAVSKGDTLRVTLTI